MKDSSNMKRPVTVLKSLTKTKRRTHFKNAHQIQLGCNKKCDNLDEEDYR